MKVLFLTNNDISKPLFDWLKKSAEQEVVLFSEKLTLSYLQASNPDIAVSYNYRHIITQDSIDFMNGRVINLHISLLPWNKGADPNLWSFIENTPKGVTIHIVDKGLDTGDILLQKEIVLDEQSETLRSSYLQLHKQMQQLFFDNWDKIKNFQFAPRPQCEAGSFHYLKDSARIKEALGNQIFDILIYRLKQKLADVGVI